MRSKKFTKDGYSLFIDTYTKYIYNLVYTTVYKNIIVIDIIFIIYETVLLSPGGALMAETKRIMISLPDTLLREIDGIVDMEKKNRSEFIREAMKLYIRERKKVQLREKMKSGYKEMSKINLGLAEMGIDEDIEELYNYESKLTGCE